MVGGEWRRRGAGQQAGQCQRDDVVRRPSQASAGAAKPGEQRLHDLVARDQGEHGGEAHLEADAHDLPRRREHQRDGGEREPAQRQGAAAEDDAEGDQCCHREAAQDRHVHARQHEVASARHQCRGSRELLAGPVQGRPLREREAEPGRSHREPHDDADVQPGHGQQMGQPRVAERRPVRERDRASRPGQQGGRDRAVGAGQRRHDPLGNPIPHCLHRPRDAARGGLRDPLRRADREAGAGRSREEGIPLQVPPARNGRRRRRPEQRAHPQRVSGGDLDQIRVPEPDADAAVERRAIAETRFHEGDPPPFRKPLDAADHPLHEPGAGRHGCRRNGAPRRELRRGEAQRHRPGHGHDGPGGHIAPNEPRRRDRSGEPNGTDPTRRLGPQVEEPRDPRAHRHGEPGREPAALGRRPAGQRRPDPSQPDAARVCDCLSQRAYGNARALPMPHRRVLCAAQ